VADEEARGGGEDMIKNGKPACDICGKQKVHLHKVDGDAELCCEHTDSVLKIRTKTLLSIENLKGKITEAFEKMGW
jgi:hypothetical protein